MTSSCDLVVTGSVYCRSMSKEVVVSVFRRGLLRYLNMEPIERL